VLLGAALTCVGALGINAPGLAQLNSGNVKGDAAGADMRSRATDSALLDALLKRRAEVAQSAGAAQSKRAALDFLDRRLAELGRRIGR
jgi:DNA-binding transcriptional regulator YdaS (Cro superfamily)